MPWSKRDILIGRLFVIVLMAWGAILLFRPQPWILLDSVNLMFHELGHLLFAFLGESMHFIGGTLGQLAFPVAFSIYFGLRLDWFALGFCLFWVGNNFINIGIYIRDAQEMALPLLIEGSIHDWNWMLTQVNLLQYDDLIGGMVYAAGVAFVIGGIGLSLYKTFRDLISV